MQAIDFYYGNGKKHTILFDGVRTSLVERIIQDAREETDGRIGDHPTIVVVSDTRKDRPPDLYTNVGGFISSLTPEFATIISKLMALYYPPTRGESVREGKEAAGV